MLLTTFLLSIAMREIWALPLPAAVAIGVGFGVVEGSFLSANLLKFTGGGWVPVLIAILLFTMMRIWQTGGAAVQKQADEMQIPFRSPKSWPGSPAARFGACQAPQYSLRASRGTFRRSWCGTSGTSDRCTTRS
jgi:hypothetical protein